MSDPGGWRALHIHLPPSVQSEYLADVILPSMSALMPEHDYFFLRYWQGGSHLRLRLRSTPERPLDDEAINEVACHLRSLLPALSDQKRAEYRYSQSLQDQLAEMERLIAFP
ncbi:lantibiotic biosynthesis dihydropyridine synthase [Cutibacterium acnes JCM 18918]|nr:lantibiotic biosynthesis dihydropyridine synthase [Cutibacterium acnes JCM 18918]